MRKDLDTFESISWFFKCHFFSSTRYVKCQNLMWCDCITSIYHPVCFVAYADAAAWKTLKSFAAKYHIYLILLPWMAPVFLVFTFLKLLSSFVFLFSFISSLLKFWYVVFFFFYRNPLSLIPNTKFFVRKKIKWFFGSSMSQHKVKTDNICMNVMLTVRALTGILTFVLVIS